MFPVLSALWQLLMPRLRPDESGDADEKYVSLLYSEGVEGMKWRGKGGRRDLGRSEAAD